MDDLNAERWYEDSSLFYKEATQLGAEVNIYQCDSDTNLQFQQAKKAIDSIHVDVIVLVSAETHASKKILAYAHTKNVKSILYDRYAEGPADYFVLFDSKEIGRRQAQHVLAHKGEGPLLLFHGPTHDNNAIQFKEGAMEILQPKIDSGLIEIAFDKQMSEWTAMEAFMQALDFFTVNKKPIGGILVANDDMASGVIDALDALSIHGTFPITGQDGTQKALLNIYKGRQTFSIKKSFDEMAATTAHLAVSLANNTTPTENIQTKTIEGTTIKTVMIGMVSITKKNCQKYLNGNN